MGFINGPYRDPTDDRRSEKYKAPKALRRLRTQFTHVKQLEAFRSVFKREPHCESELDIFAENYIIELYNAGRDNV
jgi:hypothetical protein